MVIIDDLIFLAMENYEAIVSFSLYMSTIVLKNLYKSYLHTISKLTFYIIILVLFKKLLFHFLLYILKHKIAVIDKIPAVIKITLYPKLTYIIPHTKVPIEKAASFAP